MKVADLKFTKTTIDDVYTFFVCFTDLGKITVLDKEAGLIIEGKEIETSYKDKQDNFWLAPPPFDIRDFPELTIAEAVEKIKTRANAWDKD